MKKINKYQELKEKHSKEFNKFPIKFAFSESQFKEAMKDLGLTEKDTDKGCEDIEIGAQIDRSVQDTVFVAIWSIGKDRFSPWGDKGKHQNDNSRYCRKKP